MLRLEDSLLTPVWGAGLGVASPGSGCLEPETSMAAPTRTRVDEAGREFHGGADLRHRRSRARAVLPAARRHAAPRSAGGPRVPRHRPGHTRGGGSAFELGILLHSSWPTIRFTILRAGSCSGSGRVCSSACRDSPARRSSSQRCGPRTRCRPVGSRGPPRHMPGVASPARPATVDPPPPTRRADGSCASFMSSSRHLAEGTAAPRTFRGSFAGSSATASIRRSSRRTTTLRDG